MLGDEVHLQLAHHTNGAETQIHIINILQEFPHQKSPNISKKAPFESLALCFPYSFWSLSQLNKNLKMTAVVVEFLNEYKYKIKWIQCPALKPNQNKIGKTSQKQHTPSSYLTFVLWPQSVMSKDHNVSYLVVCWHSVLPRIGLVWISAAQSFRAKPVNSHQRGDEHQKFMSICWFTSRYISYNWQGSEWVPCCGSSVTEGSMAVSCQPSIRWTPEADHSKPNSVPTLLWSSSCFCGWLGSSSLKVRWVSRK